LTETLTDAELDLIFYIERFAASNGAAPTDVQIKHRFANVTNEFLTGFKQNPLVLKSFRARGIVYPAMQDKLTDEQMHAIAVMLDPYDRRSDEKKLRDIGISTRQWATWLLDDEFAAYLTDRSERLLVNTTFEAHKGVLKGARNGNVAAAKLHYEITGRHRPNEEQQIDVRRILHTFIEIIQKYVKDPVMLHAIAMDLSAAGSAESLSTGLANSMMSGAQNVRQRSIAPMGSNNLVPIPSSIGEADDD
jgi:hypothetical protein